MLERQLLIRSKYYHLVDWWWGFNQLDVTISLRGKVELWLCNQVQESVKTMVKWCIDNILKVTRFGSLRKFRRIGNTKTICKAWPKSIVGAKKS